MFKLTCKGSLCALTAMLSASALLTGCVDDDYGAADFPGGRGRYQEYSVASLNMKNLMSPTPRN